METNPGTRRPVPAACRIILSNVQGLAGNLSDLTVASAQYVILLCSETLVSDMRQVSKLMHRSPCLAVPGQDASGPSDGCIRTRWLRSILPAQI